MESLKCSSCGIVKTASAPGHFAPKVQEVQVMTWAQAVARFTKSMAQWVASGMPLAAADVQSARLKKCQACAYFQHHQCRVCKCVCVAKVALKTERCPLSIW